MHSNRLGREGVAIRIIVGRVQYQGVIHSRRTQIELKTQRHANVAGCRDSSEKRVYVATCQENIRVACPYRIGQHGRHADGECIGEKGFDGSERRDADVAGRIAAKQQGGQCDHPDCFIFNQPTRCTSCNTLQRGYCLLRRGRHAWVIHSIIYLIPRCNLRPLSRRRQRTHIQA